MEAEEQDFIVLLLTLIAGKTLSKYFPPPSQPCPAVIQSVYDSVLPALSPSPASCTARLSCSCINQVTQLCTVQRGPKRPHPLQHRSRMSYGSIPGWESERAGAAAASQHSRQGTAWGCPGCWGHPRLSLHVSTLRSRIFQSIALTVSA